MVSGIVRPPAIDLANRDLIEAYLHAVWLAESAQELQPDIPHVLDLNDAASATSLLRWLVKNGLALIPGGTMDSKASRPRAPRACAMSEKLLIKL